MGENTDKAQKLADKAAKNVLLAIKNIEAIEKLACSESNNEGAIFAGDLLVCLRQAKTLGMKADGVMGIEVRSGST